MAYVNAAYTGRVTIFSTGGKFCPVSNFTWSHAFTLAACSYVLLPPTIMRFFTHVDTRPLFLLPRGLGSLEPRLSIPDFVSQLWKKSEGKPGRISPVIRWHHDVNPPAAKATRHTECLCYCFWEREDASVKTKSKATELPGMSQGSLFTKRSYKSQLDLLVVTASPKYWSLCMGATKKLPLKAQFCITRINSWAT